MAVNWKKNYSLYQRQFLNLMMLYQSRSDMRAYLEIILSLITISVLALFAIRPTAKTIAQLIQDNRGKEETIAVMDEKIKNLTTARALYDKEKKNVDLLLSAIPETPEPNKYSTQIEGAALQNNLTPLGMSIGPTVIVGDLKASPIPAGKSTSTTVKPLPGGAIGLPVSIDVIGDFSSLVNYFSMLENLRRPLSIDYFKLTSERTDVLKESQAGTKQIVFTISGQTPYYINE
jgi:hypothetical protein